MQRKFFHIVGTSTDLTGGPAIAAALCCNMSIKILNLSWNSLRQTTAAHLGNAQATKYCTLLYRDLAGFGTQYYVFQCGILCYGTMCVAGCGAMPCIIKRLILI